MPDALVSVTATARRTERTRVFNLTVTRNHTYYVEAGNTPVLVHNAGGAPLGIWGIDPKKSTKIMNGGPFGKNYYQQAPDTNGTVYWWSPDKAEHGGSTWKVFRATSKGLEWMADAGTDGTFIEGKYKGKIGRFIPWKQLNAVGC